ncbi:MAG: DUF1564 family protein [Leptospiraceae bacterium]|nr:DUF1564 family protein [Leptospiraceae bacterium]MDW7977147.1 DUF1564 family protein [Leptospiraceae bacterium]
MRNQIQFLAQEKHIVCINLNPNHFRYLLYLSQKKFFGDIPKTIEYLIKTHRNRIYQLSISHKKRTLTARYQPKTNEYQRFWISISPVMWGRLFQLRMYMGYSISYLLRMLLELEMMRNSIGQKNSQRRNNSPTLEFTYHNYDDRVVVDVLTGFVVFDFYDGIFLQRAS